MSGIEGKIALQHTGALDERTKMILARVNRLEEIIDELLGWELEYIDDIGDIRELLFRARGTWKGGEA